MTRPEVRGTLVAVLDLGLDVTTKYPYWAWEEAFVERWRLIHDFDSALARTWLARNGIHKDSVGCVDALRAYHVNQFKPVDQARAFELIRKLEEDYDKVMPEIDEGEMDPFTAEKVLRNYEQHNPNNPARRGRQIFDMGQRGSQ